MKYLTVFDYYSGRIYQTEMVKYGDLDIEQFLHENGFETNNCHWMVGNYKNIEEF